MTEHVAAVTARPGARSPAIRPARRGRAETALFAAAIAAQLVVLAVQPLVTQDGPAHLAGAAVLAHYGDSALYRHFYVIDLFPTPNLLAGVTLAALVRVFPVDLAEKVLVGGYVVLLPLALRYAVRAVRRDAAYLAYAALPLTFNLLLWYGFYSFCYGLALSLFAVGYVLGHRDRWTARAGCVLALLLLLTYAAHLVPLLAVLVFMAAVLLSDAVLQARGGTRPRAVARALAVPVAATVPVLALLAAFVMRGGQHGAAQWRPVRELLVGLTELTTPILTHSPRERLACAAMALVLLALALAALHRCGGELLRGRRAGLAAAFAAALGLYLVFPDEFGIEYGLISTRLSFFPVLFLLLWLASVPQGRALRIVAAATFAAAALALVVIRWPALHFYDRAVAEYEAVRPDIAPGSTLVALRYWRDDPPPGAGAVRNTDPVLHVAGRLAAQTGGVDLDHYEAIYNYFPTQFRSAFDPRRRIDPRLDGLELVPPRVRLGALSSRRRHVDYVLVVGRDRAARATLASPWTRRVDAVLAAHFARIAVSAPTGLVELYAWRR